MMYIDDIRRLLDNKKISVNELCDDITQKLKNTSTNGFITLCRENVDRAQQMLDKGVATPLTGVPIAVKDNICVKGIPTTCGSKMLEDFVPSYDAFAIKKLKDAGAVIICKSNMDEFAMGSAGRNSAFGAVKNPLDNARVAGGSSAGSAALVADGCVPAALGSDTGGSIRQPASFCGVTGFMPSYGAVSRNGLVAYASSLDKIGVIANTAADCKCVFDAMRGKDCDDMTSVDIAQRELVKGVTLALPKEFLDAKNDVAIEKTAHFYEKMGAKIKEVSIPHFEYSLSAYYVLVSAEASANLARFDGVKYGICADGASFEEMVKKARTQGFGNEVKTRILLGSYVLSSRYYDSYYAKALKIRDALCGDFKRIFNECDFMLTPTAPDSAYKIDCEDDEKLGDVYTVPMSLAGVPCASVMCGYNKNGMPLGASLTATRGDDLRLLDFANMFDMREAAL